MWVPIGCFFVKNISLWMWVALDLIVGFNTLAYLIKYIKKSWRKTKISMLFYFYFFVSMAERNTLYSSVALHHLLIFWNHSRREKQASEIRISLVVKDKSPTHKPLNPPLPRAVAYTKNISKYFSRNIKKKWWIHQEEKRECVSIIKFWKRFKILKSEKLSIAKVLIKHLARLFL